MAFIVSYKGSKTQNTHRIFRSTKTEFTTIKFEFYIINDLNNIIYIVQK